MQTVFGFDRLECDVGSGFDQVFETFDGDTFTGAKDDGTVILTVLTIGIGAMSEQEISHLLSDFPFRGFPIPKRAGECSIEVVLGEFIFG